MPPDGNVNPPGTPPGVSTPPPTGGAPAPTPGASAPPTPPTGAIPPVTPPAAAPVFAAPAGQQPTPPPTPPTGATPPATPPTSPPPGAPETYEFDTPDGKYSDELLGQFADLAKGLNLGNEAAQKILSDALPAFEEAQAQQMQTRINEMLTGWQKVRDADSEIGGAKLQESLVQADQALQRFGTPALSTLLQENGLYHNAEVVRFFAKVGQSFAQDNTMVDGRPLQTPAPRNGQTRFEEQAHRLYGTQQ